MKNILLSALTLSILFNPVKTLDNYVISLHYEKYPSYTIKIPKRVNVTSNECQFEYFYKGDIYANQQLHVFFPDKTNISDGNRSIEIEVIQENDTYNYLQLSSEYQSDVVTLSHDNLPAGSYTGELSVEIYLANH